MAEKPNDKNKKKRVKRQLMMRMTKVEKIRKPKLIPPTLKRVTRRPRKR